MSLRLTSIPGHLGMHFFFELWGQKLGSKTYCWVFFCFFFKGRVCFVVFVFLKVLVFSGLWSVLWFWLFTGF